MRLTLLCLYLCTALSLSAQLDQPHPRPEADAPAWVQLLYAETPNIHAIQEAYDDHYRTHPFVENDHTRYYKRWAILARPYADAEGDVIMPTRLSFMAETDRRRQLRSSEEGSRSLVWSYAGPDIHYTARYSDGDAFVPVSDHANIYSIDRSLSDPNILFCGGETGGIYRTEDQGMHWEHVTHNYNINTVRALSIHPNNPDIVIASAEGELWKTADGGVTWNIMGDAVFQAIYITAYDILFNPTNPEIVYAACEQGFFRSTDGGNNWTEILDHFCMSVAVKPDDANVVYTIQYDPVTQIPYFKKSVDQGATFTTYTDGWFTVPAADMGKIESLGGRIAVTNADPDRVYVLLVGTSDADATLQLRGTIGVFVSTNAGETWTHPHGLIGMPYDTDTHPNLMDFDGESSDYNQIYYNTTLAASHLDPDNILIGGLNLWKSEDGAVSYQPVGGYIGYLPYYHPDNQETLIYQTSPTTEEIWMATDGGVNYTTDWVESSESRCQGLRGSNFWGFDQGWQEDMLVGGRYHNGNGGWHEQYPYGEFIALGGGEAATGYVKPSDDNQCMFSDIGGRTLPEEIDAITGTSGFSDAPNESYWYNSSSRIQFDWNYYNHAYMGKDHKIWKSTDGASSFTELHTFGTNANNKILWVEQSRVDPQVIYCTQNIGAANCYLWRSGDGGITWDSKPLPQAKRDLLFTLSGNDADELWIAYTYGPNGSKIYHSTDGGDTWTNITTTTLNDQKPAALVHQFGTDGGVYVIMREAMCYYRTNTYVDWIAHGDDLPLVLDALKAIPFYKDSKLRVASWNIGIWEAPLFEPSALVADFSAEKPYFYCAGETVKFVDRSTASSTATYSWSFPGGTPAASTEKNPVITYFADGIYDATLTITDGASTSTITKSAIVRSLAPSTLPLAESFESGAYAEGWHAGPTGGWPIADGVSGYATGTHSIWFNNYWIDLQGGNVDQYSARYNMDGVTDASLQFDVAYAPYGGIYVDSLAVYVSTDCGNTLEQVYYAGGNDLATAPAYTADIFYPEAEEWRTETIDLSAYLGSEDITLVFRNIGYWGQALYVDNIQIEATLLEVEDAQPGLQFSISPNPSRGIFYMEITSETNIQEDLMIVNTLGETVYNTGLSLTPGKHLVSFDLSTYSNGVYAIYLGGTQRLLYKME